MDVAGRAGPARPCHAKPHTRALPLRVGTRGSPSPSARPASSSTCSAASAPCCRSMNVFEEHAIRTTGDAVQDRKLADIGGKGLFAKEIHEALADGRIDFAVHSLKDLETELPQGIVLACTLRREDARDCLVLGPDCHAPDPADPFACLPSGAVIGTASVRRQAQLLHARPDLAVVTLRGNVQTRLDKLAAGACTAALLAMAGLKRLGLASPRRRARPQVHGPRRRPGHHRRHRTCRRYRTPRTARRHRRPRGQSCLHRRACPARRARWLLPHPDRRLRPHPAERRSSTSPAWSPAPTAPSCSSAACAAP